MTPRGNAFLVVQIRSPDEATAFGGVIRGSVVGWAKHPLARRKKSAQLATGLLGRFFGKEVAARQRDGAANVGGIVPPYLGWLVLAPDRPGSPPQQQDRAFALASGRKILGIHAQGPPEGR